MTSTNSIGFLLWTSRSTFVRSISREGQLVGTLFGPFLP